VRLSVGDPFGIQKGPRHLGLQGKIDILRNVSRERCDQCGVKLRGDDSNQMTARVEQRSAAVSGLDGSADLKITRVVAQTRKRTDVSQGEICGCSQQAAQRVAHRYDRFACAQGGQVSKDGNRGQRGQATDDCKIVFVVACDQLGRKGIAGRRSNSYPSAVPDDVGVCEDFAVTADHDA